MQVIKNDRMWGTLTREDMKRYIASNIMVVKTGCWHYCGGVNQNGYGLIRVEGLNRFAHDVSFEVYKQNIPAEHLVARTCRMKTCINPEHLVLV